MGNENDINDIKDEIIISQLTEMLNECLESMNQENSFKVKGIENRKLIVAFDIEVIDGQAMFTGY